VGVYSEHTDTPRLPYINKTWRHIAHAHWDLVAKRTFSNTTAWWQTELSTETQIQQWYQKYHDMTLSDPYSLMERYFIITNEITRERRSLVFLKLILLLLTWFMNVRLNTYLFNDFPKNLFENAEQVILKQMIFSISILCFRALNGNCVYSKRKVPTKT
jgi:hypothetical protein